MRLGILWINSVLQSHPHAEWITRSGPAGRVKAASGCTEIEIPIASLGTDCQVCRAKVVRQSSGINPIDTSPMATIPEVFNRNGVLSMQKSRIRNAER